MTSGGGAAVAEPLAAIIRRVLAATVELPADSIAPTADFNDLGLSSLLAIELRRALETRLSIAISTAELFRHPTVAALSIALAERVATATSDANPTTASTANATAANSTAASGASITAASGAEITTASGTNSTTASGADTHAATRAEDIP